MDPLTHALVGASAARIVLSRPLGRAAWLPGVAGALLPDADALIRSSADPLLYAEFHRHFTHSLAFIPVGGLIAALPWLLRATHRPWWRAYLAATTVAYGTHGLLDAATTWGTRLLWPFSDARIAWNWISIVDPVFTLVVLGGVLTALWRRSAWPAAVALAACLAYLALGAVQESRASDAQARVASARGHAMRRAAVLPGFANSLVWRSLYEADGTLYVDRLRVPWWGAPTWSPGYVMAARTEEDLPLVARRDARLRRDVERFLHFTSGWVAAVPGDPVALGDARYSSSEERFDPVWGVRFEPGREPPIQWIDRSPERRVDSRALWRELVGRSPDHMLVP